jgi:hypothetical protein
LRVIVDELVEDPQVQGFDRSGEFLVIRDIPGGLDIRVLEGRQRRNRAAPVSSPPSA